MSPPGWGWGCAERAWRWGDGGGAKGEGLRSIKGCPVVCLQAMSVAGERQREEARGEERGPRGAQRAPKAEERRGAARGCPTAWKAAENGRRLSRGFVRLLRSHRCHFTAQNPVRGTNPPGGTDTCLQRGCTNAFPITGRPFCAGSSMGSTQGDRTWPWLLPPPAAPAPAQHHRWHGGTIGLRAAPVPRRSCTRAGSLQSAAPLAQIYPGARVSDTVHYCDAWLIVISLFIIMMNN